MMSGSLGALAGLTLPSACRPFCGKSCQPARKAQVGGGFKIGICDWTIKKPADPSSLQLAKSLNLDGVQVEFGTGEKALPLFDTDLQAKFLKQAKQCDIEIPSLAMGVLNDIPYKSDPRTDEWVSKSIDVAQAMGAKVVLLAFFVQGDFRDDKKGTDAVIDKLKKVAPKAEKAGVTLGLETWLTAEQQIEIIDRIGSKAVRVYYDVGNAQRRGYDVYKEITLLGREYICEVHAKDYDDLYGKGSVDFTKVRSAIDAVGYRGWIIIEGFKTPLGLEESYRYDTEYLRKIFPPTL